MAFKDKAKQRAFQLNWITAKREKYIKQIGCCFFCGSQDEIEIHHIDPEIKESHKIWSWTDDRIENELRKCIAMCHGCHTRFHLLLKRKPIKHGSTTAYRHGCRCGDCKIAHSKEKRKRRTKERG